jgi:hypothetical protein
MNTKFLIVSSVEIQGKEVMLALSVPLGLVTFARQLLSMISNVRSTTNV